MFVWPCKFTYATYPAYVLQKKKKAAYLPDILNYNEFIICFVILLIFCLCNLGVRERVII